MILKAVILFLAVMGLLAIFGKRRTSKPTKPKAQVKTAQKCPKCGAYRIGKGACACGKN